MAMMPIVNGLEIEYEGKATVISLDAALPGNVLLQSDYGLRGHPSLVVLGREGQISQRFFGPATIDDLRQALATVTEDE